MQVGGGFEPDVGRSSLLSGRIAPIARETRVGSLFRASPRSKSGADQARDLYTLTFQAMLKLRESAATLARIDPLAEACASAAAVETLALLHKFIGDPVRAQHRFVRHCFNQYRDPDAPIPFEVYD